MMAAPRAQVSMAGFFDWSSEESEETSMPSVYQKIAITHKNKLNRGNKNWCADGIHLNPGRMFVRDKANLTKGEREIIAGIYKNRGDTSDRYGNVSEAKSHKDAWLVGKQIQKKNNFSSPECDRCSIKIPEQLFSRIDVKNKPYASSDQYMCDSCKEDCLFVGAVLDKHYTKQDTAGRKAPPSSPTLTQNKTKRPKATVGEGTVVIESEKTWYDSGGGPKKKKVFVDVFLPKFPPPSLNEETTNLSLDINTELERKLKIREHNDINQISKCVDEGYSSQDKPVVVKLGLISS